MKTILAGAALAVAAMVPGPDSAQADTWDYVAELGRVQEYVAPDAKAEARFQLVGDGSELLYEVTVGKLENFVQAHIHLMPDALAQEGMFNRFRGSLASDDHGPIVVFLSEFQGKGVTADGLVVTGVIKESDLVGPFSGYALSLLIELMEMGGTYVALHVLEPIPPGNSFCCPIGMRGMIEAESAP